MTTLSPNQELRQRIEAAEAAPLYVQIFRTLRTAILEGQLFPEGTLPPERELAHDLGVTRTTVRRALRQLEEEGLLKRYKGSGTYLSAPLEQPLNTLTGFSQDMARYGLQAGVIWLNRERGLPTSEESFSLSLSLSSEVSRLKRLRTANDEPIALELAVLPVSVLPDPFLVGHSLYDHLAESGIHPGRALQRLKAGAAEAAEAELLHIAPGSPVLHIQRLVFIDNRPIEFTKSTYRGDRYEFVVEMNGQTSL
ncbi:GntR family transcriptional regulator [Deinococcus sp. UYEF24]